METGAGCGSLSFKGGTPTPPPWARHIANIYGKLGVDSRAKLTAYALRHGLV